jgi:hypothetical protein
VIECQPAAMELVGSVAGVAEVVSTAGPLPEFDVQCALMSLPGVLGTTVDTIPGRTPYLAVAESSGSRVGHAMGPLHGFRIGLAWGGNPLHGSDRLRSVSLDLLLPLTQIQGIEWYSLHIGESARAEVNRSGGRIRQILTEHGGVPELADLMSGLDLILTVDTMTAHLAGALHRPVWTMLCWAPDWRWHLAAERTPWYPSMRLFRQPAPGCWQPVIEQLTAELRKLIAQESGSRTDKGK